MLEGSHERPFHQSGFRAGLSAAEDCWEQTEALRGIKRLGGCEQDTKL